MRGAAWPTGASSLQRYETALLVDPRAEERVRTAVACAIEDGVGEREGGAPDASPVGFVHATDEVDEAGEGARELEGDGEEGSNRRRGRRVGLRGK